ncbi:MAG: M28 family peptidase, partial [Bacteroidaceae bacterium]|nr:M28 family peptidase [Bacteroidaceae bacterium]
MKKSLLFILPSLILFTLLSCKGKQTVTQEDNTDSVRQVGPAFMEDSAYSYCAQQCDFGPRTMNSKAHDDCRQWIVDKFASFGMEVIQQNAVLNGYDGTPLKSTNIIAQYKPELESRILLCAHWDARPWADNDPDEANHKTAIDAANDGASGVAVMLEIARLLQ